jgi:hypothetical protein
MQGATRSAIAAAFLARGGPDLRSTPPTGCTSPARGRSIARIIAGSPFYFF